MPHFQHRSGAPSRPRADHHTRWARPEGEIGPIRACLLLAALAAVATLLVAACR